MRKRPAKSAPRATGPMFKSSAGASKPVAGTKPLWVIECFLAGDRAVAPGRVCSVAKWPPLTKTMRGLVDFQRAMSSCEPLDTASILCSTARLMAPSRASSALTSTLMVISSARAVRTRSVTTTWMNSCVRALSRAQRTSTSSAARTEQA
jgi:hypothetical protein